MKVGVKIGPALDGALRTRAERAEALGFDSVWLSERVAVPLDKPHPYAPMADPWVALAHVAAVTSRVRLGTSVSQIALRPPWLMARELATLDHLSGGRLIVGAGAGWVVEEFNAAGVPFDDRGGRLNEAIRAIRHCWTSPETAFHGRYYDLPPAGTIMPLTPGGPPIYAGGINDAGFRRAARYCDGFIAITRTPEQLAETRAKVMAARARYNPDAPFPFLAQVAPPEGVDAARELARTHKALGVDAIIVSMPLDGTPLTLLEQPDVARALIEEAA